MGAMTPGSDKCEMKEGRRRRCTVECRSTRLLVGSEQESKSQEHAVWTTRLFRRGGTTTRD